MRPLIGRPFKCSACGSRDVALWLFAKRAEADRWVANSGARRAVIPTQAGQ